MSQFLLCQNTDTTFVGRGNALGVGAESLRDHTVALQRLLGTRGEFLVGELHVDGARGDVDDDDVTILDLADVSAIGRLRRDMADGEAAGTSRERYLQRNGRR